MNIYLGPHHFEVGKSGCWYLVRYCTAIEYMDNGYYWMTLSLTKPNDL